MQASNALSKLLLWLISSGLANIVSFIQYFHVSLILFLGDPYLHKNAGCSTVLVETVQVLKTWIENSFESQNIITDDPYCK